jgi:hypothetical protein
MVSYFVAPTLQSQRSVAGVTARASSATGFRRNYARCPRRCGARSTWNSGVRRRDAAACRCEPTVVPRGTRANQVSDDCSRASGAAPPVPNAGRVGFAWNSDSRARPAPATWNDPSALVVAHARLQTRGVPRGTRTRPLHRASCWLRSHRGCSTWNKNQALAPGIVLAAKPPRVFHVEQPAARSEEGSLCWDSRIAGIPLGTWLDLLERLVSEAVGPRRTHRQAESGQPRRRPPGCVRGSPGVAVGRFADRQRSADTDEWRSALRRYRGRSEAPRHHEVERPAQVVTVAGLLRPSPDNDHTLGEVEVVHCLPKEAASSLTGIQEHRPTLRPPPGQHQPRHTAPAAEV